MKRSGISFLIILIFLLLSCSNSYNQVIDNGTGLHINNEMLRQMVSEMGTDAPVIELKSK